MRTNSKIIKIIVFISPIIAIASFLTLGNNLAIKNAAVNNIGFVIVLLSLIVFIVGLIILVINKLKTKTAVKVAEDVSRAVKISAEPTIPTPIWYRRTKLIIGLAIILGIYVVIPFWAGLIFLPSHSPDWQKGPMIVDIFFGYFVVLTQYALPVPGFFVWLATAIGLGLIIFRNKRWIILDVLAIVLVAGEIILLVNIFVAK